MATTVGGGHDNQAGNANNNLEDASFATVAGGKSNTASAEHSTVSGGRDNNASGRDSTVGGGHVHNASGDHSTIAGGSTNETSGKWSAIGGGIENISSGEKSTVGGGSENEASGLSSTVGGGSGNKASGTGATVGGGGVFSGILFLGEPDRSEAPNIASGIASTVGGGILNVASGVRSTVAGGFGNTASGDASTIGGGGFKNEASGLGSTISGGVDNVASSQGSTVGGGFINGASGFDSTIGGGRFNTASGHASTVPGGHRNTAAGDFGFAAGHHATVNADHDGTFLFADSNNVDFRSAAANEFAARATGGVRFVTEIDADGDPTAGVQLAPGDSAWSALSDRNAKANFGPVDGRDILERLSNIPVETWNYKSQDPSIRHIGPMAQDFHAAFGVGADDKRINTVDADGVSLAAIQGLYQIVQDKDAQITAQQQQISALQENNRNLEARIAALEGSLGIEAKGDQSGLFPFSASVMWMLAGGLGMLLVTPGVVLGYRHIRKDD